MAAPSLTERSSPWVIVTARDDPWVVGELEALRARDGLAFRLDAREFVEPSVLFRVFARELFFPDYFGHNWDALADCLHHLHGPWHGDRDIAVLIDHADCLLGKEFLALFVSVLCQAAWNANLQLDADGQPQSDPPFALHFILLSDRAPANSFTVQVAGGQDVTVTLEDGRLLASLNGDEWPMASSIGSL